jgi:hypothetical protein
MVEYGVVVVAEAAQGGIADRLLTVQPVASYVLARLMLDVVMAADGFR